MTYHRQIVHYAAYGSAYRHFKTMRYESFNKRWKSYKLVTEMMEVWWSRNVSTASLSAECLLQRMTRVRHNAAHVAISWFSKLLFVVYIFVIA